VSNCGYIDIHTVKCHRLLSTHADRQEGWIYRLLFVCVRVFVRLRICPPTIKLAASDFARRFIGVQGRESPILGNFAPPEAQNRTNRPPVEGRRMFQLVTPRRSYQVCAACGRRIGMCGYTSVTEDGRTCVLFSLLFFLPVGRIIQQEAQLSQKDRATCNVS